MRNTLLTLCAIAPFATLPPNEASSAAAAPTPPESTSFEHEERCDEPQVLPEDGRIIAITARGDVGHAVGFDSRSVGRQFQALAKTTEDVLKRSRECAKGGVKRNVEYGADIEPETGVRREVATTRMTCGAEAQLTGCTATFGTTIVSFENIPMVDYWIDVTCDQRLVEGSSFTFGVLVQSAFCPTGVENQFASCLIETVGLRGGEEVFGPIAITTLPFAPGSWTPFPTDDPNLIRESQIPPEMRTQLLAIMGEFGITVQRHNVPGAKQLTK